MSDYALVLEDDATLAGALAKVVSGMGYEVQTTGSIADAREAIDVRMPAVMLVDINLPDGDGVQLMNELQGPDRPSFIVITGDSSQEVAVQCIRARAFDMLAKPIRLAEIKQTVARASKARQEESRRRSRLQRSDLQNDETSTLAVGTSPASDDLRAMIGQAAAMPRVLCVIDGDTGVEKNAVAEAIHRQSETPGRLITVNCAGEKDANAHSRFFGAQATDPAQERAHHAGYLEQAAGGTLVLDDLTALSLDLQARLLGFLDTGQFLRTNGVTPLRARVGMIGIARGGVQEALASGALREDFYYRLAQFSVKVPRLQQRADDKLAIAEFLLTEMNERTGANDALSDQAREAIVAHTWPGNVREMKNALHRAVVEGSGRALTLDGLETGAATDRQSQQIAEFVGKTFWQIEKELLFATLDHHGGDKDKTARTLGISLKTLYNRLHAYS